MAGEIPALTMPIGMVRPGPPGPPGFISMIPRRLAGFALGSRETAS
jgi:hypothetical protein